MRSTKAITKYICTMRTWQIDDYNYSKIVLLFAIYCLFHLLILLFLNTFVKKKRKNDLITLLPQRILEPRSRNKREV